MNNRRAEYDFLIVGAGLYGSTFAYFAKQAGKKCLVIDKRNHIGGNIYCKDVDGINVHQYGAHIFHTNDKTIWDFVNRFATFNRYTNSPIAISKGRMYNLPFNMNTFYQLWGIADPAEVKEKLEKQINSLNIGAPKNLEEQALKLVGTDIYNTLIKEYTEKQWGRKATELPAFIIKRLPIRFTFDNNYFSDKYQGIPTGGYNLLAAGLLKDIELELNVDFFEQQDELVSKATQVVYTGQLDRYYDYRFGELEYRSLRFEHKHLNIPNFQGNAVVNYNDSTVPYTRIIEHKHFEFGSQDHTVITYEYPEEWSQGKESYYPVNDETNMKKYSLYAALAAEEKQVIFGGRLAEYRYYDMHQVIASAMAQTSKLFSV